MLHGIRTRFTATVESFGKKNSFKGKSLTTILLVDVYHEGELMTDHLWMTAGKWSRHLKEGDTFSFDSRITKYIKGYRGHRYEYEQPLEVDFRLSHPTNVEITNPNQLELL